MIFQKKKLETFLSEHLSTDRTSAGSRALSGFPVSSRCLSVKQHREGQQEVCGHCLQSLYQCKLRGIWPLLLSQHPALISQLLGTMPCILLISVSHTKEKSAGLDQNHSVEYSLGV